MLDKLLEANGAINPVADKQLCDTVVVPGDTDIRHFDEQLCHATELIVNFASSADGRGFSLAAQLRESTEFDGKLFASGMLNPDQLSLAFQCGFDGVIINETQWRRYGEAAWTQAMEPVVNKSYLRTHWCRLDPIWERRVTPPGC